MPRNPPTLRQLANIVQDLMDAALDAGLAEEAKTIAPEHLQLGADGRHEPISPEAFESAMSEVAGRWGLQRPPLDEILTSYVLQEPLSGDPGSEKLKHQLDLMRRDFRRFFEEDPPEDTLGEIYVQATFVEKRDHPRAERTAEQLADGRLVFRPITELDREQFLAIGVQFLSDWWDREIDAPLPERERQRDHQSERAVRSYLAWSLTSGERHRWLAAEQRFRVLWPEPEEHLTAGILRSDVNRVQSWLSST